MNSSHSQKQGERPSWEIICVADQIDTINDDHAFLTTLHEIARDKAKVIDPDLYRLLVAYLDTEPRQKLSKLSENLMQIAKSIS